MINRDPNIFVISSQAPLKSLGSSFGVRQGKSGQIVQRITGCDMFVVSDDPVSDEQASILKKNINHNSWIIITGHGSESGGFGEIVGETDRYIINPQFLFDAALPVEKVKYPISRYVDLLTEQGNLRKGEHINLVLFVCHAAKEDKIADKKSFAERLGKALAEKEISSYILANESVFNRLKDPSVGEVNIQNKPDEKSLREIEPPFVFVTNKYGKTIKYQAPGSVMVTKEGVIQKKVSNTRKKYNESFLKGDDFHNNIDKMYHCLDEAIRSKCDDVDYDANKVTFNQFMTGKDDASKSLNENSLVKFAIGVSESKPDCYRLSYLDDNRVKNKLFKFKECENMLKFIDEKSLWYDPYDNYKFVGSDYLELSSDKESPSARRIGLFDDENDKTRQGSESSLAKDQDGVKKSGNNNKY